MLAHGVPMRLLCFLIALGACATPSGGSTGGDDIGNDGGNDGGKGDGPTGDDDLPPSPANVHWIGGACSADNACAIDGGMCLTDGFPNGMCSLECTSTCPDRGHAGDTVSFCTDGRPFGFDTGICVSRCDPGVLPGDGCAAGYRCVPANRYAAPATVQNICVPDVPAPAGCPGGHDELIAVHYPDEGMLWIPKEAQCGGSFPLVVALHGINPQTQSAFYLGQGWQLEHEVRALIDAKLMTPVIIAAPVHFAASSSNKYNSEWDPTVHLDLVTAHLAQRGITLESLSYVGHSGAGCADGNGLYRVLDFYDQLIPAYAPRMRLWGAEDICYGTSYHWTEPLAALAGKGIAMINLFTIQGDPTDFENNMIPPAHRTQLACPSSLYKPGSCIAHDTEPWCSYRSQTANGMTHDNTPFFFFREALPQVFSPDPTISPCR